MHRQPVPTVWRAAGRLHRLRHVVVLAFTSSLLIPYVFLLLLSCGSGWTFPRLLPDRLDMAPWKALAADRDGLLRAAVTSVQLSLLVGVLATLGGLLISRSLRRQRAPVWRFLLYLPFVISPVIAATSLYDLNVRLGLAGTFWGVLLSQLSFATAFATVFFCELWNLRTDRLESLVRSCGGSHAAVWRHVVWPESRGLVTVCLLQAALFSWLDYGMVSVIGGGRVTTLTTRLFAYVREASINQAGLSALFLLLPVLATVLLVACSELFRGFRLRTMTVDP